LTSTINTVNTAFLTGTTAFVSAPGNPQPDQQGGGVWGRTIAGTVDTSTSSTGTLASVPPGNPPPTGAQHCDTSATQDYWGYQVGKDISVLNGGGSGANFHFGVTGGYIDARTKDTTPAGSYVNPNFAPTVFNTPAGDFASDTIVPFVGIYGAFTQGNFFADGQARWDFYQNTLNDPINGLVNQRMDATGFSLTGNIGYHVPLHNNWFIEPSGGVVYSRVSVDPLNVSGQANLGGTFAGGTVRVDDIESVLGRASLSFGTSFQSGGVTWQPYFTASVFHEFNGDVTATSLSANNVDTFGAPNNGINGIALVTRSTGGVGTYGQFALGSAAVLGNTGWLGYARVDYRIGDNIDGWGVNAGLRYQFSPEQRGGLKDGGRFVVTGYNWTGPYIGLYLGTDWGDEDWKFSNNARVNPDFAGTMGGGQAGYNLQLGRIVVGIEGEYGAGNAHGGVSCPNMNFFTCEADTHGLAMFTGRIGTTWGRALFYAKGGLAVGEVEAGAKVNAPSNPFGGLIPLAFTPGVRTSNWQTGWTVGGGMEFALTNRWSAKAEYMYYDLGDDTFKTFSTDTGTRVDTHGNLVRIGVNYHLHSEPPSPPLK
jgi:opacity protein-like surface antigen